MTRTNFAVITAGFFLAAMLLGTLSFGQAFAADIYLKLGTIKGESIDDRHKDWIEIISIGSLAEAEPDGTNRYTNEGFVLLKLLDKASPKLAEAVITGERFDEIIIELCTSDSSCTERITMQNALITSYSVKPMDAAGDNTPMEEISFIFEKISSSKISESDLPDLHDLPDESIPDWIKNNARWWSEKQIDDSDFVNGIEYLIKEGIIRIPQTQAGTVTSQVIPDWIKNNAGWWADGLITDNDFVQGIQYLISNGIMKI